MVVCSASNCLPTPDANPMHMAGVRWTERSISFPCTCTENCTVVQIIYRYCNGCQHRLDTYSLPLASWLNSF